MTPKKAEKAMRKQLAQMSPEDLANIKKFFCAAWPSCNMGLEIIQQQPGGAVLDLVIEIVQAAMKPVHEHVCGENPS